MRRREFMAGLLLGAMMERAVAQSPARVYRIGVLSVGTSAPTPQLQGLWDGLRKLGYVEGRNFVVERRGADGRMERVPTLAAELVSLKPDVIVTIAAPPVQALKDLTRAIPIVMVAVADPVALSLVSSYAHPGGNITGVAINVFELAGKRVDLLKQIMPEASAFAVLLNASNPSWAQQLRSMEGTAKEIGVKLVPLEIRTPEDIEALKTPEDRRVDGMIVGSDPITNIYRKAIIAFSNKNRLPTMWTFREEASDGGLIAYGADLYANFYRAAAYVDSILQGANPAELPIEDPVAFNLVVNLKAAKALGVEIPPAILARADEVIE